MNEFIRKINDTGNRVFYNPKPLLKYETLATGSLAQNTYRGFHKIDKMKPGSKDVFDLIFLNHKDDVIKNINNVKTEADLNKYQNEISKELTDRLKKISVTTNSSLSIK